MSIRFLNKGNKRAEILLYGEVGPVYWGDEVSAKDFAQNLKDLGAVDVIDLRINSYGGDVFEGLAIHRQLMDHGAEITTHVDGVAASIASVIAMAGKKIIISESGMMMIHDAWTIAMGNAEDFRSIADRLETTSQAIADVYVARSGKSNSEMRAWMRAETEFFGKAAVDAGLADEVAENMRLAARAKPDWDHVRSVLTGQRNKERREAVNATQTGDGITTIERPAADARRTVLDGMRTRIAASKQTSGRG